MRKVYFVWFVFAGLLTSCSPRYTYFTKDLMEREQWTAEDLSKIQFYLSKDIVLSRVLESSETKISEGKIKVIDGRQMEYVILKANTPGVLVQMPKQDRYAVSFEESDDEAYLMFGPSDKLGDRFVLLSYAWDRHQGQIHYKGNLYTVDASSAYSGLLVDLQKEDRSQHESYHVSGRTIRP